MCYTVDSWFVFVRNHYLHCSLLRVLKASEESQQPFSYYKVVNRAATSRGQSKVRANVHQSTVQNIFPGLEMSLFFISALSQNTVLWQYVTEQFQVLRDRTFCHVAQNPWDLAVAIFCRAAHAVLCWSTDQERNSMQFDAQLRYTQKKLTIWVFLKVVCICSCLGKYCFTHFTELARAKLARTRVDSLVVEGPQRHLNDNTWKNWFRFSLPLIILAKETQFGVTATFF